MSEEHVLPILAAIGFNEGANKGFWRVQPREQFGKDAGQWIEMGADVLFRFRTGSGNLVVATDKGIYVGPSGRPGMARVMIPKDTESGLKAGVYEVESRNLQQFKAILPTGKGTGAGTRKDKFGRPVKTLEDSKLPALENLLADRKDITPEDERLAKGELTPEEKEAEQDGRAKSPVADLPSGFEAENPDKVKELLRESGIDPDEFDKSKKPKAAGKFDAASASDEELKEQLSKDMTDPNWSSAVKEWSKRYNPNHTDFMASSPDFSVPEGTKRTGVRQYGGAWDANDYVMGPNGYWQTAGQQETSKSIKPNKIQEGMVVKNPDGTTNRTVKMCMPFLDSMTSGYIQETWQDIEIELTKVSDSQMSVKYIYKTEPDIIGAREKTSGIVQSGEFYPIEFTFHPVWIPELPKGWSMMYMTPQNRIDLPFQFLSGIVDNDEFTQSEERSNIPFYIKKSFSGVIPKGTPLLQMIPVKRENWEAIANEYNEELQNETIKTVREQPWGGYKKHFWTKKNYK
jgi:hypothetical protein